MKKNEEKKITPGYIAIRVIAVLLAPASVPSLKGGGAKELRKRICI